MSHTVMLYLAQKSHSMTIAY